MLLKLESWTPIWIHSLLVQDNILRASLVNLQSPSFIQFLSKGKMIWWAQMPFDHGDQAFNPILSWGPFQAVNWKYRLLQHNMEVEGHSLSVMFNDSSWDRERHYTFILNPYSIFQQHLERIKPQSQQEARCHKSSRNQGTLYDHPSTIVKLKHTLGMRSSNSHAIRMFHVGFGFVMTKGN